jgi:hypothetical protein
LIEKPRKLDSAADLLGDTGLLEESREERPTVTHPRSVVVRVASERGSELAIIDLLPSERIPHHAREVPAVNVICCEVSHSPDHRGHREAVDNGPLVRQEVAAVDPDVRTPSLLARAADELEPVRLEITEPVDCGGGAVGDRHRVFAAKSFTGPAARVKGKPSRVEVIERRRGRANHSIDAMRQALERPSVGESRDSLASST